MIPRDTESIKLQGRRLGRGFAALVMYLLGAFAIADVAGVQVALGVWAMIVGARILREYDQ